MANLFFNKKIFISIFTFILGIIILLFILQYTGIAFVKVKETITQIGFNYFFLIIVAYFGLMIFVSIKFKLITENVFSRLDTHFGFYLYYASLGMIVNICLPWVGTYGLKVGVLKKQHSVPIKSGIIIMFLDQYTELFFLLITLVPAFLYLLNIITLKISFLLFITLILLMFFITNYINILGFLESFKKWSRSSLINKNFFSKVPDIGIKEKWYQVVKGSYGRKVLLTTTFKYIATILKTYFMMIAVGMDISLLEIFIVTPIIYLIGNIGITPGGLGIVDTGWLGILTFLGVEKGVIGKFLVVDWIIGTVAIIVIIFVSNIYYKLGNIFYSKGGVY